MINYVTSSAFSTWPHAIVIKPIWQVIETEHFRTHNTNTWIWAATITIQKTLPQHAQIEYLELQWQGNHITDLVASLYKPQNINGALLTLEQNCVADALWNSDRQTLTFPLHQHLSVHQALCLVLVIPKQLLSQLHHGSFYLKKEGLPFIFHDLVAQQNVTLPVASNFLHL